MTATIVVTDMTDGIVERLVASLRALEHAEIPGPYTVHLTPTQYDDLRAHDDAHPEALALPLLNGMLIHVESVRFVSSPHFILPNVPTAFSHKPPTPGIAAARGKRKGTRFPRAPRRLTK